MKILIDSHLTVQGGALPHLRCAGLVISKDHYGGVISCFSHDKWQVGGFINKFRSFVLNFELFYPYVGVTGETLALVKWILVCVWQLRNGNPIAVTTVRRYLYLLLDICKYCWSRKIDLSAFFYSYDHQVLFCRYYGHKSCNSLFHNLLVVLHNTYGVYHSLELASYEAVLKVRSLGADRQKSNQHPPLPPRLYGLLVERMDKEFQELMSIREGMRSLISWLCESKGYLRNVSLRALCKKFGLEDFFRERGYGFYRNSHVSAVNDIYYLVKTYLHIFTGMRDDEVNCLRNYCYRQKKIKGVLCSLIAGDTYKGANGKAMRGVWITTPRVKDYIEMLQYIVEPIFLEFGVVGGDYSKSTLFPSPGYLMPSVRKTLSVGRVASNKGDLSLAHLFKSRLDLTLIESDIVHLEVFDPYRNWRADPEFAVGNAWPLTTHQLRRSLALYAVASGLVSLPSLKRQLKHISIRLTKYYASGGDYVFGCWFNDASHFASIYRGADKDAQAVEYIIDVILSEDKLYGGHGAWVENTIKPDFQFSTQSIEETYRQFRHGERSYCDSPLGGCSAHTCPHRSLGKVIYCWGCSDSVIRESRLDLAIAAQNNIISGLDKDGVLWRTEHETLNSLLKIKREIY